MNKNQANPKEEDVHLSHTTAVEAADHIDKEGGRPFSAAVVGGDARQVALAKYLAAKGCHVTLVGMGNVGVLPDGISVSPSLGRAVEREGVTRVILPLPATRDGHTVWCPMDLDYRLTLDEVAALMSPGVRLYGGCLPTGLLSELRGRGLWAVDYYTDETLQVENAHITAEGAVLTAMELTDRTVRGANMAVVGYGRIGQMLARMLVALGADVTAFARRADALAWAEADGCHTALLPATSSDERPARMEALYSLCHGYDVIFNTVPARILGPDQWRKMTRSTLWIELASAPGGVDPEAARNASAQTGLRVVWAPSLPGRYAPATAGEYIARWILADNDGNQGGRDQ